MIGRLLYAGGRRTALLWIAALTLASTPATARAGCLEESIASCNADFSSASHILAGIRGWCYLIRTGMCKTLDKQ